MTRRAVDDLHFTHFDGIDALVQAIDPLPEGDIEIAGRVPIHLRWRAGASGTRVTIVMFSAAVGAHAVTVPIFSGARVSAGLETNVLFVSDPSLILSDRLFLGWYAGCTDRPDFENDLARIIRRFAGETRTVLFGTSGGGAAALRQAANLPGSTAIAINPQTILPSYKTFPKYASVAWGIQPPLRDQYPFVHDLRDLYALPVDAQVVYVQNSQDVDHVRDHCDPFMAGLHPSNRVRLHTPDLGEGHVGLDGASVTALLAEVCADESSGAGEDRVLPGQDSDSVK